MPAPPGLKRVARKQRLPMGHAAQSAASPYFQPIGPALSQEEQDDYKRRARTVHDRNL